MNVVFCFNFVTKHFLKHSQNPFPSSKRIQRNQSARRENVAHSLSHEIWIMPHTNVILILPFSTGALMTNSNSAITLKNFPMKSETSYRCNMLKSHFAGKLKTFITLRETMERFPENQFAAQRIGHSLSLSEVPSILVFC